MRVRLLAIENFRGIKSGEVRFEQHMLLVGGNKVGASPPSAKHSPSPRRNGEARPNAVGGVRFRFGNRLA